MISFGLLLVFLGCSAEFYGDPSSTERVASSTDALLGTDVQVQTGLVNNEPHIAINPLNSQVIAVSQCFGVALSFDGGKNFTTFPFNAPAGYGGGGCDDVLTFDAQGRLFVTFLDSKPNSGPGFGQPDLFVQRIDARPPGTAFASRRMDVTGNDCTTAGANASQCPVNVTAQMGLGACNDVTKGRSADRQWLVADERPACGSPTPARSTRTCSPFSNNLYLIWTDSACGAGGASGIRIASSSNRGATWASQLLTAGPGDLRQVGLGIAANGDAYAGYHAQSLDSVGQPDGLSGQIVLYQSQNGTAAGFAPVSLPPLAKPVADVTRNAQQCSCGAGTCALSKASCSFSAGTCPNGTACQCGAGDTCNPPATCPNSPIPGFQPCSRRLNNDAVLTWGSDSPFIVGDPTNPNDVAVFASTDPNRAGTAVDNFNVNYVVSTNAASGVPTWSVLKNVTPGGAGLPASNQLFPQAVTGLSSSCVTLAYYDDRNPATDAQGNKLMDVFVTVNPNLWSTGAWQPEVKVNHTAFNPDVGTVDFFSYCGITPGCVTPAGWRSTSRIGEYFGLLQASGIAWTGNSGSPPAGQQILFNYSDGIPPVVTAPPNVAVSACGAITLGTATATDTCGLAPLSAVSNDAPASFSCGSTLVTYTATDGAGNVGTAKQTVTVTDATAPAFVTGTPTSVSLVACQPTPQPATLQVPAATSSCGAAVVTGAITTINGVHQSPAIAVPSSGQATVAPGVYTVVWTATNCSGVTSKPFIQTVTITAAPALYARQIVTLDALASIVTPAGTPAPIDNNGTVALGLTSLAPAASAGTVLSVPSVTLTGSTTGSVVSGGLVVNVGGTVNGTITQFTTPTLPPFPILNVTYPPNLNEVNVFPLTTVALSPGSYDNVLVDPGGTLALSAGTYLFNTMNVAPAATIQIDNTGGTVFVNVQTEVFSIGQISSNGPPTQFVLGYTGAFPVGLLTNFAGVVIAPSAALALAQPLFGNYMGAFYAQDIVVAAGVKVTESGYACSIP